MEMSLGEITAVVGLVLFCVLVGYAMGVGSSKKDNEKGS